MASDQRFLPSRVDLCPQPVASAPSLHVCYGASSLLRTDPPQCCASVLCSLQICCLELSLDIAATGSHVPYLCLVCTSCRICADSRSGRLQPAPELLTGQGQGPAFDCGYTPLDTSYAVRVPHLVRPYLTASFLQPFPKGFGHQLLTDASSGGLKPPAVYPVECSATPWGPAASRGLPSSDLQLMINLLP